MWVLWVNWILIYSLEIQLLPLSMPNDQEQICLWTIFILMFCGSDQKPLEAPNYGQIMMDPESFLVVGICSSQKMMQNKLVCFSIILFCSQCYYWHVILKREDLCLVWRLILIHSDCAQRSSVGRAEILKRSHSLCHLKKRQCDTNLPI